MLNQKTTNLGKISRQLWKVELQLNHLFEIAEGTNNPRQLVEYFVINPEEDSIENIIQEKYGRIYRIHLINQEIIASSEDENNKLTIAIETISKLWI